MSMPDITAQKARNPHKILKLRAGVGDTPTGASWVAALAAAFGVGNPDDFFAPGIADLLGMDNNTTLRISTSADIKPALGPLLDKLKEHPLGRIARGVGMTGSMIQGAMAGGEVSEADQRRGFVQSLGLPPNVRYQTELSLLPAWNATSPVQLESLTFRFTMGMTGAWDARREVYNPVIALAAANLPVRNSDGSAALRGPLPTQEFIFGAVIGGLANSIYDRLANANTNSDPYSFERAISGAMQTAERAALSQYYGSGQRWTGIWSVQLGRIQLPDFYVTNTSYSFSTETDEHGFPIWGEVTWSDIKSLKMAHRGLPLYRLFGPDDAPTDPNTGTIE